MTFYEDLTQRYPQKGPSGKMRVLQFQHDIARALDDGFTRLEIWQTLNARGEMPVAYHVFNRYLRDLQIGTSAVPAKRVTPPPVARLTLPRDALDDPEMRLAVRLREAANVDPTPDRSQVASAAVAPTDAAIPDRLAATPSEPAPNRPDTIPAEGESSG